MCGPDRKPSTGWGAGRPREMHFDAKRDSFLRRMRAKGATTGRSPEVQRPAADRAAFTLIELLTVIAIIGVLVSITIGIGRGVQERAAIGKAKAELAVLAAALEQYKLQYGDYPWTPAKKPDGYVGEHWDGGVVLVNALCGNLGPKGEKLAVKGRTFIDLAKFSLASEDPEKIPDPTDTKVVENWFDDPWGKWIWYYYRKGPPSGSDPDTKWLSPSFLLYSHGPDGECETGVAEDTGLISDIPNDPQNADNIYAGH